ncbi:putative secondary metabolism biosynthetic enzyme [Claviceps africana]|uniref:Secondary metabolism biosynthetic enzyme n=1 Tax=Claviceps africana TaxID=83212 RepID=A0A8K0J954_9HYPO|nr:putative secondary metabolism biosynthetic enzyme [Claviceps africana]
MLVVFSRPNKLNAMTVAAQYELEALFAWYDAEPSLRCAVVTGAGRAFCSGMDLREWNDIAIRRSQGLIEERPMNPPSGFGGLSRRHGKKPVIGAVNGLAFGGGLEILANLDLVFASQSATFALTEVKRGVVANAGSLPRLVRTIGRPRATELALTGRTISASEAKAWCLINDTTPDAAAQDVPVLDRPVVKKALAFAGLIARNSPDGVIISRAGILSGWEDGSAENASRLLCETWNAALYGGENHREGLRAFVEKREPRWVDSKL